MFVVSGGTGLTRPPDHEGLQGAKMGEWLNTPQTQDNVGTIAYQKAGGCISGFGCGMARYSISTPKQDLQTLVGVTGVLGGSILGGGLVTSGLTRADLVRYGPTVVSNQLIYGRGVTQASIRNAVKGGGGNLSFHYHIGAYNWYKPWTWFRQTPIIKP